MKYLKQTLVLGIGDLQSGDDGVGVHAARALLAEDWPCGAEVRDVGMAMTDALPALANAHRVIILDAVKYGRKPGTVYRIPLGRCRNSRFIVTCHGYDIYRMLTMSDRKVPPKLLVLGVEPAQTERSPLLSPAVSSALPFLLEAVRREVSRRL